MAHASGPGWPSSWTLPRTEVAFEAAFEHSYNAMVVTDADFNGGPFIRRCNPAFCAKTGYTEKELIGQSPRILQGPDTDRQLNDQLDRTIRAGEFFECSTFNYRKDGVPYVVQWNISPVRDADGGPWSALPSLVRLPTPPASNPPKQSQDFRQEVEKPADHQQPEHD